MMCIHIIMLFSTYTVPLKHTVMLNKSLRNWDAAPFNLSLFWEMLLCSKKLPFIKFICHKTSVFASFYHVPETDHHIFCVVHNLIYETHFCFTDSLHPCNYNHAYFSSIRFFVVVVRFSIFAFKMLRKTTA